MPPVEPIRTPATTRKRARCPASPTASLSLLAVPKLKAADPASLVKVDGRLAARACKDVSGDVNKGSTACPTGVSPGKENQAATFSSSAGHDSKLSQQPAQTQHTDQHRPVQATSSLPKHVPAMHKPSGASQMSRTPKKAAHPREPAQPASNAASAGSARSAAAAIGQSGVHAHAIEHVPNTTLQAEAAGVAPALNSSPAKRGSNVSSLPMQGPAFGVEGRHASGAANTQELLDNQETTLACQTAINKRRYWLLYAKT